MKRTERRYRSSTLGRRRSPTPICRGRCACSIGRTSSKPEGEKGSRRSFASTLVKALEGLGCEGVNPGHQVRRELVGRVAWKRCRVTGRFAVVFKDVC